MLSTSHAREIMKMEPTVLDGAASAKFDWVVANNIREEKKKNGDRSDEIIRIHTAKGIGLETYLLKNDFFSEAAPVVEDARKDLTFIERSRDLLYFDQYVQVKSLTRVYGNWSYISESTFKSITGSHKHNSFYIFGMADQVEDNSTLYTYKPYFAIESKTLAMAIRQTEGSYYVSLDGMSSRPHLFQPLCQELIDV